MTFSVRNTIRQFSSFLFSIINCKRSPISVISMVHSSTMKKIVCNLILFCLISHLYSQKQGQARIDSLLQQMTKTREDSNKVKLLDDLSYLYKAINEDEGIKYGQQALSISKKIKWAKGMAEANEMIGINYYSKSDYTRALEYYERALKISKGINYKLGIAEVTGHLSIIYNEQ